MSAYWYCVKHKTVESGDDLCPPIDRLGPFDTSEEASKALHRKADSLQRAVTELGRAVPGPWRAEEKTAALAAWLALARRG